ncbi:MAG TPA: DNA repair protein RecO [Longimicrobiales bacterium]|nr:DNA repair protein RecO [Longimicrobiales bacterium]
MALVSTDAIILQTYKYSDSSKILKLLTRSNGLQSVIAKGAAKPKSQFGGVLEPFVEGVATFYAKEQRDLHTLSGFDLRRSRQGLGADLIRFGGASLIAELILRSGIEEADADLFELVSGALDRIQEASKETVESVVLGETWALIAQLGFAPSFDECISCGRAINTDEDVHFDYGAGGVRCDACAGGMPGRTLPAHARAALIAAMSGEHVIIERTAAHWRLLARYIAHHVLDGNTLNSLNFLAETLAEPE